MRVLCFLHSFDPGGVERTALRLCAQWRDDGVDVAVMLGRASGAAQADAPDLDYRFAPPTRWPVAWIETLWMIAWLPGIIRRFRPDVLFCAGNSYTIVAAAMKLLLGRRCPPIVAKISNDLSRADMPTLLRLPYHLWCLIQGRLIGHWIALSPAMQSEASILLGIDADRITVIANPVLDKAYAETLVEAGSQAASSRSRGRRFLAAGRLVAQKDYGTLIAAFAQGGQPDDRLIIVGEGRMRGRLTRLVRKLGVGDRISLPGHSRTILPYLASSDVLILSSRFEGLPAVVVEAIGAGLQVIATDCCSSMRALVEATHSGVLVPVASPGALSVAIAIAQTRSWPNDGPSIAQNFVVEAIAPAYRRLFARACGAEAMESVSQIAEELA